MKTKLLVSGILLVVTLTACMENTYKSQEKTEKWLKDGNITEFTTEDAHCYVYRGFGISCVKKEQGLTCPGPAGH